MDTYTHRQQIIERLVQLCVELGVAQFVVAPGSRSAPLTTALAHCEQIQKYVVYDERAAGYLALGIAQQHRQAVGLVCTSGTAALNFAPAITEAYYQRVPLLVLTADRPPEWIDQQDNQAIHQPHLYQPHILGSFELPSEFSYADAQWFAERTVAQAIHLTHFPVMGPVHINIPLREPIYPSTLQIPQSIKTSEKANKPFIHQVPTHATLSDSTWASLLARWHTAKRKLIIAGMHAPDARLNQALARLGQQPDVAVIADITANLYPQGTQLYHSDMIAGVQSPEARASLAPDLVISYGGQIVSKYIKQLIRHAAPQTFWQLHQGGLAPDAFQAMSDVLPMGATDFFEGLSQRLSASVATEFIDEFDSSNFCYANFWHQKEKDASQALSQFLAQIPFGEFSAVQDVLQSLPPHSLLQLGNSMPIRYANFIAYTANMGNTHVYANRGTSGIDGTVSTAVGAAITSLANQRLTTLLVGDLAFFYDRNGLWHNHLPANLRIVLLNNHGGGIFDIIEGPNRLARATQERFFLTPQPLTAKHTASDHGLDYFHVHDQTALRTVLPEFFAKHDRAAILEIETDMTTNTQIFNQFKAMVAKL